MRSFGWTAPLFVVLLGLGGLGIAGGTEPAPDLPPGAVTDVEPEARVDARPLPGDEARVDARPLPGEEARVNARPLPGDEARVNARPSVNTDILVYGDVPLAGNPMSDFHVLKNKGFVTGWSETRLCPVWTAYRVDARKRPGKLKRPSTFSRDARAATRVTHRDYTRSGYDRGHMAPNHAIATRYGREAQVETFLMTNVCPQTPDLNRGVWKDIEAMVAGRWASRAGEVWVITGPVYDDERLFLHKRRSGVEIPDAFFKIVIDELPDEIGGRGRGEEHVDAETSKNRIRTMAFLIPQDVSRKERPAEFLVSIDWIEERTGLDLMPGLPDEVEEQVESVIADRLW